jgi:hypothetical protein
MARAAHPHARALLALALLAACATAQRVNFTVTLSAVRPVAPLSATSPPVMGANLGAWRRSVAWRQVTRGLLSRSLASGRRAAHCACCAPRW